VTPKARSSSAKPIAPASASPDAVIASGHARLRFPEDLEAAFKRDTLEPRRRLLTPCAVFACVGVLLGSLNIHSLVPEIADQTWRLVWLWLVLTIGTFSSIWFKPSLWQQNWRIEAFTAAQATTMSLLITWMATQSRTDTAITHSAMAAIPVMYCCVAVRQRFYWALACAAISFFTYAFFVTGFTSEQALIAHSNIRLMAVSYVFVLAANYSFEHSERRNWLLRKVEERQRQALLESSIRFQQLCNQDSLTGLANRRQFDAHLAKAWAHAETNGSVLSLLVVDVDFFKAYNDSKGHPAGDVCLTQLGRVLADVANKHGYAAARLGGEEFGILLPGCSATSAEALGQELRQAVEAAAIAHDCLADTPVVTVSVGGAQVRPGTDDVSATLLERADGALYRAKQLGRNQVCFEAVAVAVDPAVVTRRWRDRSGRRPAAAIPPEQALSFPSPDPERESALNQTLDSHFRTLRFPAGQEAAFRQTHSQERRLELVSKYALGLLIFNVYILTSRVMFHDIGSSMLAAIQLGVTLGLLGLSAVTYAIPMPLALREGLFSVATSVIGFACAWFLAQSQLTTTLSFAAALALIPIFVGVGARQPFRSTFFPAVVTCASAAWLLTPHTPVQQLVYQDTLFILAMNTLFALVLAYTLEHAKRKAWLLSQIDELQHQALESATSRLQLLSSVDPLTGIRNRRQFEEDLTRIWQEGLADHSQLAMLIIDVDHFKKYNDGYGHPQGDHCLKRVATIIHQAARADRAMAARLGGEEFVILLPQVRSVHAAARLGERVCQAVREAGVEHRYVERGHVTVSVGVAVVQPGPDSNRSALFSAADKALYEAKNGGRDRVSAPKPPAGSLPTASFTTPMNGATC
jgi:diguanylate cyclase (GGDEF)-like protein